MRRLAPCALWLFALGCSDRVAGADGGIDAAASDAAPPPTIDGGGRDASAAADAGLDASEPPGCACPSLPTSCVPPAVLAPAFTPEATDVAGQLFAVIACADTTLKVAVYEAQWACIASAIQAALDRDADLVVELVVDDRECPVGDCFVDTLGPTDRVTVRRDARAGLMHHKFALADDLYLWVGSPNFTTRSFCTDVNDSLVIDDPVIVGRYGDVFDRMFDLDGFGPVAPEGATTSGPATVYFSPESPTSEAPAWLTAMVTAIGASTTSVEVMVFAWTRTEISDAIVAAVARGVDARAIVPGAYADDAPAQALLAAGVDVRVASVHSKVMILDGATVVTGSANWSENAWSNNENSLWITDPEVADAYGARFDAIFADATPATITAP